MLEGIILEVDAKQTFLGFDLYIVRQSPKTVAFKNKTNLILLTTTKRLLGFVFDQIKKKIFDETTRYITRAL